MKCDMLTEELNANPIEEAFRMIKSLEKGKIYHYTDLQAFMSILENKCFWASKSDFLNDRSESIYIKGIINRYFESLKMSKCQKQVDIIYNGIMQRLDELLGMIGEVYILSFSLENDLIPMWSNYSNGDGINMSFDILNLERIIVEKGLRCFHGKIRYNEAEQKNILESVLDKMLDRSFFVMGKCESCPEYKKSEDMCWRQKFELVHTFYLMQIVIHSMFFKHRSFEYEREYRIAFINHRVGGARSTKLLYPIYYRTSNSHMVPYIKVPIGDKSIPLDGVRIAPSNNNELCKVGIDHFLSSNNYMICSEKSEVPFRKSK